VRALLGIVSELRGTLLVLGLLFIGALAWWERRRPRQASRTLERPVPREAAGDGPPRALREPGLTLPEIRARERLVPRTPPIVDIVPELPTVPVLEPASEAAAVVHGDGEAGDTHARHADGAVPPTLSAAEPAAPAPPSPVALAALPRESLPELPPVAAPLVQWPPDRERQILALRLVAPQLERFAGRSLRQALAAEGFVLGEFAIFHKGDEERRAVLSAASLTRPGTFDKDTMDSQHFGGLSLFVVLPGPKSPPQAFDELVFAARNLNERLHGVLQDEQGTPLTPARVALLRAQLRDGTAS